MTKANLQMQPPEQPAVIGSPDTTFGGSRNAFSPLVMWHFLSKHSERDQMTMIGTALEVTDHAEKKLKELGGTWEAARTPLALTVQFKQPPPELVHKYSLATIPLKVGNSVVHYAHLYVMPHVTKEMVDALVADLAKSSPVSMPVQRGGTDLATYVDGSADTGDIARLALVHLSGNAF
jgi:histidine decarboxylase